MPQVNRLAKCISVCIPWCSISNIYILWPKGIFVRELRLKGFTAPRPLLPQGCYCLKGFEGFTAPRLLLSQGLQGRYCPKAVTASRASRALLPQGHYCLKGLTAPRPLLPKGFTVPRPLLPLKGFTVPRACSVADQCALDYNKPLVNVSLTASSLRGFY